MFESGLEYVRVDFHLHTKKDKEFTYGGDDNNFIKDYIEALKRANIQVGVITNHNKFDNDEFKALRKKAKKEQIYLLPGVELSVKEGANGIHTLIIFNPDEWFEEGYNHIQNFLSSAFAGIPNPENKNSKCIFDLKNTLENLDSYGKDYFIVFAHVDQGSGLFKECKPGLLKSLSSVPAFKKRVLGLQKSRICANVELFKKSFDYLPACVEGSDPKSIETIGKGKEVTYIKIGVFSYSSIKFALQDHYNRVSSEHPILTHGYIEAISFTGGKFNGQKITFSPNLNTIVGIRGSGKSSIIEAIRFLFEISPQTDENYKDLLVKNVLGSGGKISLTLVDKHRKRYIVSRILGERTSTIEETGEYLNISPVGLLEGIQYFGQKDLSDVTNHENILLNKFVTNMPGADVTLTDCSLELKKAVEHLININNVPEEIKNKTEQKDALEHKMAIYKEKGVAQKLRKQTGYFSDKAKLNSSKEQLSSLLDSISSVYDSRSSLLDIIQDLESEYNPDLLRNVRVLFESLNNQWNSIGIILNDMRKNSNNTFEEILVLLEKRIEQFSDAFAKIKREIKDDTLNADDFVKMSGDLEAIKLHLKDLNEKLISKKELETSFVKAMSKRNEILLNIFRLYENEIHRINNSQDRLRIAIEFKGDKESFKEQLKNDFRGTGISDIKYQKIIETFSDYVDIICDWIIHDGKQLRNILSNSEYNKFERKLGAQYSEFLNKSVKDKIEIYYHDKLLKQHSIGQRASALILFILTQTSNDVIIIDQPEDDLDNKVIYDEVIKAIVSEKNNIQFIFATHNANIPVLGDAERILVINYEDSKIDISEGNIDSNITQQQIVDIMEGGKEAFKKRQLIYNAWNN